LHRVGPTDLLVVGTHGHGRLAGLVAGSVSRAVLDQMTATCWSCSRAWMYPARSHRRWLAILDDREVEGQMSDTPATGISMNAA
jgi:hypothetical protein